MEFLLFPVVPIAAYLWARRHAPRRVGLVTGVSLGIVADPASLGLYIAGLFLGPFGLPIVLLGLALGELHGVGYKLAVLTHVIRSGVVVDSWTNGLLWTSAFSAAVWTPIYGTAGWFWDRAHAARS